jgi:uncharacterized protein (DUF885 family)
MRTTVLATALVAALCGCQPSASPAGTTPNVQIQQDHNAQFAALSELALRQWMQHSPISATQIGEHRYDNRIDDVSAQGIAAGIEQTRALLDALEAIDTQQLSRDNQVDAAILRNQLEGDLFRATTLADWQWDPQFYSGLAGSAIYGLMARDFAPLPDRLRAATERMEQIPQIFAAARANLDPARVPKIHAETVARQNRGILSLVETFITPNLDQLQGDQRQRLQAAISALEAAVNQHQQWLDEQLVPNAKGDFRIGA